MNIDKQCVTALLKIISEHRLQGREALAVVKLMEWVNQLESRLKEKAVLKEVKK